MASNAHVIPFVRENWLRTSLPDVPALQFEIVPPCGQPGQQQGEEDQEGEDELLPAMADDDYSAQLSWQSQSKDNLKCVFSLEL